MTEKNSQLEKALTHTIGRIADDVVKSTTLPNRLTVTGPGGLLFEKKRTNSDEITQQGPKMPKIKINENNADNSDQVQTLGQELISLIDAHFSDDDCYGSLLMILGGSFKDRIDKALAEKDDRIAEIESALSDKDNRISTLWKLFGDFCNAIDRMKKEPREASK